MASVLNEKYFHDEAAAFEALEGILWPEGPICPHCGATDRINKLEGVRSKPSKKHPQGKVRHGLWKCYHCRGQFTVRKGTVFESSHLELHQWFQAAFLMCSSKKGVSANQLHRTLGVTLKTAWFVGHRLREAMREGQLAIPFGSNSGAVESDETFYGRKPGWRKQRGNPHAMKVLTLIDRDTRQARSAVIDNLREETIWDAIEKHMTREARLMTDEGGWYYNVGQMFAEHQTVNHSKDEYVRGEAHVNSCEGYFSIFKRGMKGV